MFTLHCSVAHREVPSTRLHQPPDARVQGRRRGYRRWRQPLRLRGSGPRREVDHVPRPRPRPAVGRPSAPCPRRPETRQSYREVAPHPRDYGGADARQGSKPTSSRRAAKPPGRVAGQVSVTSGNPSRPGSSSTNEPSPQTSTKAHNSMSPATPPAQSIKRTRRLTTRSHRRPGSCDAPGSRLRNRCRC